MPSSLRAPQRVADAPPAMPTQSLLGVPLALTDYEHTLDWIDAAVASRSREYICVAAVHTVMACQEDESLRAAVLAASFTVPDGQPLVWALRALGHDLGDRVYGPSLMDLACARAAKSGQRMYLYGGRNQGALAQLTRTLRLRHPGLKIVGGYAPPFRPLTDAEEEHVAQDIDRSGADVVWVGIGVPKQEKWMARMRPRLQAPVLIGVGAAFDFHAGLVPQAPPRMQRWGLEWLFRFVQEPRRLWKRYARYNPLFVFGFTRQYLRHRTGR
ncbi:WecB/TagA/CpsF family glycosyltransferase [Solirubrobacter taibaiensis]|nr:WecB/TagA/CpsF family glycosyltransferase [Solirubrobacter taibaiensis]